MKRGQGLVSTWSIAAARAAAIRRSWHAEGARFEQDESGSTTILTLFIFIFMLVMAGVGIDTMRYEMERTHLQATLDNAVLAGAGAPLGTEVEQVKDIVVDYFAKAGMSNYLHSIDTDGEGDDDIETSLNATRVYAEASMSMDTYLMKLSGVSQLDAFGAAQAEVRTPKLEVAVVLDVSGSMGGWKMSNMKTAARSFVTTILDASDPGNTVISLVPFAWTVTPGDDIFNALTVDESHDYSSCLRFFASDYDSPAIDPDRSYDQQIYTALYGDDFDDLDTTSRSCYPEESAEILPYSMSEADLHTHIDSLNAGGNTSAHIGMKWGTALLDPSFDSVVTSLQGAGVVDASLENIPAVYNEADTLKVIVLMADGQNTTSYYFDDDSAYRGPDSDLYLFTFAQTEFKYGYTIYNASRRYYESWAEGYCSYSWFECVYEASEETESVYYLRDGSRYYDTENEEWLDSGDMSALRDSASYVGEERLDWEVAWGMMSPRWYGEMTGNWGPWNDYVGSQVERGSTKDTRMQAICSAAKARGIVVYTIGYSISAGGNAETQLQGCASSANHYYPTNGNNISAAFSSIASNVQNLRLTQ